MTPEPPGIDFFVTYTGADAAWAEWVAFTLEDAGYSTQVQVWDFRPGQNFMVKMDAALARARHTMAILSAAYMASPFTEAERTAAYRLTLGGKDRAFIPVRVEQCDPGPLLGPVVYIDLVGADEAEARKRLLAGVVPGRDRTGPPPPFPGDRPGVH